MDDIGTLKKLKYLEEGYEFVQADYDSSSVLDRVSKENLENMVGNVTGCVVKFDVSGTEFEEIWATDSTFAPSLDAIYERVK